MRVAFVPFTAEIDAEMIACAREQLPPPQRPSEVFSGYQLGDCLKMCVCTPRVIHNYPRSFSAKFKALACEKGSVAPAEGSRKKAHFGDVESDHVLRIFAEAKGTAGFREPETNSLVIHLRLGDMVERAHADVQTMLLSGANPATGGRTLDRVGRWPTSIKSVHELLVASAMANVTTVHIVGGGCWRYTNRSDCIKSSNYARCVGRAFEHQGYNTTLSIDGENADQDFYFMAHAKHFIQTSGGFSRILAQLVEKQGGTVYGRQFAEGGKQGHWSVGIAFCGVPVRARSVAPLSDSSGATIMQADIPANPAHEASDKQKPPLKTEGDCPTQSRSIARPAVKGVRWRSPLL